MSAAVARALFVITSACIYLFAAPIIVSRDAASLAVIAGALAVWTGAMHLWFHVVYPPGGAS